MNINLKDPNTQMLLGAGVLGAAAAGLWLRQSKSEKSQRGCSDCQCSIESLGDAVILEIEPDPVIVIEQKPTISGRIVTFFQKHPLMGRIVALVVMPLYMVFALCTFMVGFLVRAVLDPFGKGTPKVSSVE